MRVSRTIVRQVMEQGVAILGSDIPGSSGFGKVESLIALQVRSLLCVPMTVFERVIGCIYLDSTDPLHRFDDDHLELVTAIAGISAMALENARRLQWLEQENQRLMTELNFERSMLGESPKMKEVFQFLTRAAPTDSTVLIYGETGSGKELIARAIHDLSSRGKNAFVKLNCAAIPTGLLESEMFGHERGAFTGAFKQQLGKFELAAGGTLFLDEIGDLRFDLQAKLLRAIQEGEIERVGGTKPIKTAFRLIAATNIDLERAVKEARFREDLYYRINVIPIRMPPLRERLEDLPELARLFLERYKTKFRKPLKGVSDSALKILASYWWPGNIRELENLIERLVAVSDKEWNTDEDLPLEYHFAKLDAATTSSDTRF